MLIRISMMLMVIVFLNGKVVLVWGCFLSLCFGVICGCCEGGCGV